MVRRKGLMGGLAKQLSMSAYQNLVSPYRQQPVGAGFAPQTIIRQRNLTPSTPEYWHAMCNKLVGAMPRMATMTQPDASSRKLNRLRRNLMKPASTAKDSGIGIMSGYMQPQRNCQPANWVHPGMELPKEYGIVGRQSPTSPTGGVRPGFGQNFEPPRQQIHNRFNFGMCAGNFIGEEPQNCPSQTSMYAEVLAKSKEFTPVSILKKRSCSETGREPPGTKPAQVISILRQAETPKMAKEPSLPSLSKPALNPRCKFSEPLVVKATSKPKSSVRNASKVKPPSNHPNKIPQKAQPEVKAYQEQSEYWHSQPTSIFNFGKCASHYLDSSPDESDSESIMYKAANAMEHAECNPKKSPSRVNSPLAPALARVPEVFHIVGSIPSAKLSSELPKRVVKVTSKRFLKRLAQRLESGNNTSTITLTEDNVIKPSKSARSSQTTLRTSNEVQTPPTSTCNLDLEALKKLLHPEKSTITETMPTEVKSETRDSLNLNELLSGNKVKNMEDNPLWDSLMRLVVHMCDAKGNDQKTDSPAAVVAEKSRLSAGDGQERKPKQYSVYLLVSSDEEDGHAISQRTSSLPIEVKSSKKTVSYSNLTHKKTEYTEHCHQVYEQEHPKIKRRKRRCRRNLCDTQSYCLFPEQLPIRRPLHWPKPDMSKPENRQMRTSSMPKKSNRKRSMSLALEQHQRSWRMYENQPLNARALQKEYSRLLGSSHSNLRTVSCK
ncbi:uncharacterized protein LOC111518601 [Drosophila willistoni]|uniref:uncharacterized protein LOC111518601 n=1 Tax=Drosophila willistoni TaxID=7260 RepID=UPI000C26CE4C|nr:uncharacterized protein LOC111518601 [Drosophila willistoni]